MENNQNSQETVANNNTVSNVQGTMQTPSIDYDKIQGMIDSRNAKTEESVLKDYFQKQGLSTEEAKQAMKDFKSQREKNSQQQIIDNNSLKTELANANKTILQSSIEKEAIMQAISLGVDIKTVPYLSKMADFSKVSDEQGNIDKEAVKTALQQVLDDIPGLKTKDNNSSDLKIGADGSDKQNSNELFNFDFTGVRKR